MHGLYLTYQVLARKWRPQAFDAVVGQDAITRTLRNALAAGRIAHAYLFAGPRGVGKTTTARLLARALMCLDRDTAEPCERCAACEETRAGTSMDLIEIDAASNRKIDDVRALRENVKYAPSRGRYKVYIIDEAHQITPDGFDALLKTLEEPPSHVVFVLATTDPRELPPTILSRVQRFDFRPIAPDTLVARLEEILREEKIEFEPAALPQVVRAAEGSLRDALSLLDTAIAYGNGRIAGETVAQLLGATAPVEVRAFAAALLAYDVAGALGAIDRAVREGEDLGAFTRDVIELLRRAMVLRAAPTAQLPDLTTTEANELRKLGEPVSLDEILYVVRAFLDADELMRDSPHPRVELEIATVRATRRPVPQALEEVLRRVDEVEGRLRQQAPSAPTQETLLGDSAAARPEPRRAAPSAAPRPIAEPTRPATRPAVTDPPGSPESPARVTPPPGAVPRGTPPSARAGTPAPTATVPGGELDTLWQRVIEDVMAKKAMLAGVLMHARAEALVGSELTVVLTGSDFHRERLADPANRELVRQAIKRHIAGAESFNVITQGNGGGSVAEDPTVRAALEEFQGEIVNVRRRAPEGEGQ
ncbi:MAG: DNA polymerase III subunit gamma/tau [Candidatus Rokubacteria bacterium]|nr:DNA polymerase III subunit gamma/tau [Candidatus Rokubacteria bacterium]